MSRTLPEKYLSEIPVSADVYKVDLELLDRYNAFAAEVLRLALLGVAGYGFLLTKIVADSVERARLLERAGPVLIWVGLAALAVSAASALAHRYFATDSMAHHVRKLRLRTQFERVQASTPESTELGPRQTQPAKVLEDDSFRTLESREKPRKIQQPPPTLFEKISHEADSLVQDLRRSGLMLLVSVVSLAVGVAAVAVTFGMSMFPAVR